jgi:hypothetical protein
MAHFSIMQPMRSAVLLCIVLAGSVPASGEDSGRVILAASAAKLTGERLTVDKPTGVVSGPMRASDSIDWGFRIDRAGWYQVVVHYALAADPLKGSGVFEAQLGDQTRLGPMHATGASDRFLPQVLFDPVELPRGDHRLTLRLKDATKAVDLRILKTELVRAREPGAF